LQLLIKLKSTTNASGPDESNNCEGLSYDPFGYACPLPHFVGLLRSPELKRYVDEVRELAATGETAVTARAGDKRGSSDGEPSLAEGSEYQEEIVSEPDLPSLE
jgi:hypothetical protein